MITHDPIELSALFLHFFTGAPRNEDPDVQFLGESAGPSGVNSEVKNKAASEAKEESDDEEEEEEEEVAKGAKKHRCEICPKGYSALTNLLRHKLEAHSSVPKWPCKEEECTYACAHKSDMNRHLAIRHNRSPYPKELKREDLARGSTPAAEESKGSKGPKGRKSK